MKLAYFNLRKFLKIEEKMIVSKDFKTKIFYKMSPNNMVSSDHLGQDVEEIINLTFL
jgi:hypothetical protein